MRSKVKRVSSEVRLTRILNALAQELIDTPDAEFIEATKELGMDLEMKESAAFAGLKYPAKPQLSDFFDLSTKRAQISTERKNPKGK